MKRLLFLVFALAIAAHAQAVPPFGAQHGWVLSFGEPAGTTQFPAVYCTSTVKTSCIVGYTALITPPVGAPGGVATIPPCSGTATTGCFSSADYSGTAVQYSWEPGGLLYCGTWGFSVVANWLDNSGAAVSSTSVTASGVESCPFVAGPPSGALGIKLIP